MDLRAEVPQFLSKATVGYEGSNDASVIPTQENEVLVEEDD